MHVALLQDAVSTKARIAALTTQLRAVPDASAKIAELCSSDPVFAAVYTARKTARFEAILTPNQRAAFKQRLVPSRQIGTEIVA